MHLHAVLAVAVVASAHPTAERFQVDVGCPTARVDTGKHDELLEASELYRRMCARLSVGKSLDDPETVDELIEAAKR